MNIGKSLAFDVCIELILSTKRHNFKKGQYDKNDNDEEIQSPEKSFRVNNLFDARMMKSLDNDKVKKTCSNFKVVFSHKNLSNVDANDHFFSSN